MFKLFNIYIFFIALLSSNSFFQEKLEATNHLKSIVFGAGCFWSVEKKFQDSKGVLNVVSGYADGKNIKPIYKEIIKRENKFNPNNFAEVVKVTYNSNQITLSELVKIFFEMHDPTQINRQGNDVGTQYRSLVLVNNFNEINLITALKNNYQKYLNASGYGPIVTEIKILEEFFLAENYHQDYLKKNPNGYCPDNSTGIAFSKIDEENFNNDELLIGKHILILEAEGCPYCLKLRNDVLDSYDGSIKLHFRNSSQLNKLKLKTPTWATPTIFFIEEGKEKTAKQGYLKKEEFYKALGLFKLGKSEAYNVAFNQGTDPTYCREYELFKNTPKGTFIDKLSGAPLFETKYRFNSNTGWLSFTQAVKNSITKHMDYSYGMTRVEVKSKSSGIHLGHVFNDGPNGLPRYCINATVLEFVPDLDT